MSFFGMDKPYPMQYNQLQIDIEQTTEYANWFESLRDNTAKARIDIRIRRLSLGHWGDAKSVGDGVLELRIHHGPGYRVYFMQRGAVLVVLLAGGTKASQQRDIEKAKALAQEL